MTTVKVPFNLLGEDAELAEKLRLHLEKKLGMKLKAVHVARLAYRALAEKEGIDDRPSAVS